MNKTLEEKIAPYRKTSTLHLRSYGPDGSLENSIGEVGLLRPSVQDGNILNLRADISWIIKIKMVNDIWIPVQGSLFIKGVMYFGRPIAILPSRTIDILRIISKEGKLRLSLSSECRIFALRIKGLYIQ